MTSDPLSTEVQPTRAWVLHPDISSEKKSREPGSALDEAVALAAALPGLDITGANVVRVRSARAGLLFGSGKVDELGIIFKANDVELVLIDGTVSPVQQRNLERDWKVKILDRTGLILEIFSDRARTREGVLQVEMAALAYQRTRLVRAWTHLERQRGGLGFVGGPGETQIEADRRAIDDEMGRLKKRLNKVMKTRALHRAARAKVPFPIVALVGYTNAGKSTLFNRLTGANALVKDMLFATLDPTMRSVQLSKGTEIILSDTVGFISDLPTELVASFRATLEEVLSANLILHVRDISHAETEAQAQDVDLILDGMSVDKTVPVIEVWNKVDRLNPDDAQIALTKAARAENTYCASALTGEGLDDLIDAVTVGLEGQIAEENLTLTYSQGRQRAWLFDKGLVESETQSQDGYCLQVRWTARNAAAFRAL